MAHCKGFLTHFTHHLPPQTKFTITTSEWEKLLNPHNRKSLQSQWSDVMAAKLKSSNPYCSFGFKRHWLKQSMHKTSDVIFKANGYCKFDSCPVLVTLSMPTPSQASSYVINVSYSANVHHKSGDTQSRFIKGDLRSKTMEHLSKFSPYVRHQGLANMPPEVFHAGNRDGYGRSPRVLQQIASEGKRSLQLDKSCLHSLLIL